MVLHVFMYFLVSAVALFGVFVAYGKLLLWTGRFRGPVRFLLAYLIAVPTACLVVLPLGAGLVVNEAWHSTFTSGSVPIAIWLSGNLLSALPGMFYFSRRYVNDLRKLGF